MPVFYPPCSLPFPSACLVSIAPACPSVPAQLLSSVTNNHSAWHERRHRSKGQCKAQERAQGRMGGAMRRGQGRERMTNASTHTAQTMQGQEMTQTVQRDFRLWGGYEFTVFGRVHRFEGWVRFACCTNGGQQLAQQANGVHRAAALPSSTAGSRHLKWRSRGWLSMPAQIQTAWRRWPLESNTRVQASKPLRGEQTHREAWSAAAGAWGSSRRIAAARAS